MFSVESVCLFRGEGIPVQSPSSPPPTRSNLFTMKHGLSETTEMSSCFNSPSECENYFDNKMHSSRMLTARFSGRHQWGEGMSARGVSAKGRVHPPGQRGRQPPLHAGIHIPDL